MTVLLCLLMLTAPLSSLLVLITFYNCSYLQYNIHILLSLLDYISFIFESWLLRKVLYKNWHSIFVCIMINAKIVISKPLAILQVCSFSKSGGGGVQLLSHVQLFWTPWTVACQAPLSTGFPRQKHRSGLPFPSPGDIPNPEDQTCISCVGRQILYC